MRKPMMIALAGALLLAACGEAGDVLDEPDFVAGDVETTRPVAPPPTTVSTTQEPVLEQAKPDPAAPTTTTTTTSSPGSSDAGTTEPESNPVPPPEISHPSPHAALALADLADRLNVTAADIVVVATEEVTWSDGSLGCPEPGMRYTQALVNGTRVILQVDGVSYYYHSGPRRDPFLCKNPVDPVADGFGDV